jgi:hypothetical protein
MVDDFPLLSLTAASLALMATGVALNLRRRGWW